MTCYTQLSLLEREKIFMMKNDNNSFRTIAKVLGRSHTTIAREYRRNIANDCIGYLPDRAENMAKERHHIQQPKIVKYPELKNLIITKMRDDRMSPEMIAGRLKYEKAAITISHETIYRFVYSKEGMQDKLYQYLIHRRPKRNQKYGRKTKSNYGIPDRVSISKRPAIPKREFGHFETDLTFFANSKKINLSTMVERKTGFMIANLNHSKESANIAVNLINNLSYFPRTDRKSITFDNGKEFVMHNKIKQVLGISTYFCHPGAPWEKPYVETSHAFLHRFIPKKTDANTLTEEVVQEAINKLNNLPRKRFNFKTPAEMLRDENILLCGALRT